MLTKNIDQKYTKTVIVNFFFIFDIIFSSDYSRNLSDMLIWSQGKIYYYHQCWKPLFC